MMRRRARCIEVDGVNKGSWTEEEDAKLEAYVQKYGHDNWRALPKLAGLKRCGKSCRLRWINYLCPHVKRGNFTMEEEEIIIRLHAFLGNKWSKIASCLPGRTDNEVKNMWHTYLKKRVQAGKESIGALIPPGKKKARRLPQAACDVNGGRIDAGLNGELVTQTTNISYEHSLSCSDQEHNCSSMENSSVTTPELLQVQSRPLLQQQQHYHAVDHQEIGDLCTDVDPEEVWSFLDLHDDDDDYCFMQFPQSPLDPLEPPGAVANCNISIINVVPSAGSGDQEQGSSSCSSSTWDEEKDRWLEYLEKELEL